MLLLTLTLMTLVTTISASTCVMIFLMRSVLSVYIVSQQNCAKLFLLELRQIYTDFDNFWQKDGKEANIM